MDQIEQEGFNLNISRYVSLSKDEEEVDLEAVHRDLVNIENEIQTATAKHNELTLVTSWITFAEALVKPAQNGNTVAEASVHDRGRFSD